VEVWLHVFLASLLDGGEVSASLRRKNNPSVFIGWKHRRPEAGLDVAKKRKISCHAGNRTFIP
jgi:hypothetical protein